MGPGGCGLGRLLKGRCAKGSGPERSWGFGAGVQGGGLWEGLGFEERLCDGGWALVAPRVFVIYCPPPPRDLTPFLLLLSFFFLLLPSLIPPVLMF